MHFYSSVIEADKYKGLLSSVKFDFSFYCKYQYDTFLTSVLYLQRFRTEFSEGKITGRVSTTVHPR